MQKRGFEMNFLLEHVVGKFQHNGFDGHENPGFGVSGQRKPRETLGMAGHRPPFQPTCHPP